MASRAGGSIDPHPRKGKRGGKGEREGDGPKNKTAAMSWEETN